MAKLTDKQRLFCKEYLIDLNASRAARAAGYSQKRASEIGYQLLHKTTVAKEIQRQMDGRSQRTLVEADDVIRGLQSIVDDATRKVQTDRGEQMVNASAAIRALELLGKHLGLFTDKRVVEGSVQVSGIIIEGG